MRCYDLIQEAVSLLNDPSQQFYKQSDMLRHANRALREVMNRAMTLREVRYSPAVKDQGAYGLPMELLRVQGAAWKRQSQWDPLSQTSLTISQYLTHEQGFRSDRPYYFDVWGRGRVEKYAGQAQSSSQTHITLDNPVEGILVGDRVVSVEDGSEAEIVDVVVGTGSTTLEYKPFYGGTRETLKKGVIERITVLSATGYSEDDTLTVEIDAPVSGTQATATATVVSANQVNVTVTDGGSGYFGAVAVRITGSETGAYGSLSVRRLDEKPEIRVVSHYSFPHVLYISPPPLETSEPGEEPLWLYLIRTHYKVTQELIDNGNDTLEVDLELETCVLYRLLYWASMQEGGAEDMRTMKYQTDYETEYFKQQPYIRRRIHQFESAWGKPGVRVGSRSNVLLSGVSSHAGHIFNRNTIG